MKKSKLLNAELNYELALLGHTDTIVVADAGLPISRTLKRIDLALAPFIPGFIETLSIILSEIVVEKATIANEIKTINPDMHERLVDLLNVHKIEIEYCSHEIFKQEVPNSRCVVRTGECSPYANIILHSGVNF